MFGGTGKGARYGMLGRKASDEGGAVAEKNPRPVVAFFDVDGTLTCRDFNEGLHVNPTPGVEAAIRAFTDAGNVAVVCSGRSVVNLSDLTHLPFSGFVTLTGAHVIYDGRVIYDRAISPEELARTVDEMRRVGLEVAFEGTYGTAALRLGLDRLPGYEDIPSLEEYERSGLPAVFGKANFTDEGLAAFRSSEYLASAYTHLNVGDGNHELTIPGTSKGVGGQALLDALPFTPSHVFAFGDSENDLEILRLADTAVVMGNARDVVKAHADYVTDDVRDDGVVTALRHFGLI